MNKQLMISADEVAETLGVSMSYAYKVVPAMAEARAVYDEMEPLLGEEYKPFPCYEDLLFRV